MCIHVPSCMCGGQRTTCMNHVSPVFLWRLNSGGKCLYLLSCLGSIPFYLKSPNYFFLNFFLNMAQILEILQELSKPLLCRECSASFMPVFSLLAFLGCAWAVQTVHAASSWSCQLCSLSRGSIFPCGSSTYLWCQDHSGHLAENYTTVGIWLLSKDSYAGDGDAPTHYHLGIFSRGSYLVLFVCISC